MASYYVSSFFLNFAASPAQITLPESYVLDMPLDFTKTARSWIKRDALAYRQPLIDYIRDIDPLVFKEVSRIREDLSPNRSTYFHPITAFS